MTSKRKDRRKQKGQRYTQTDKQTSVYHSRANYHHGAVASALPPSLHHVHQFHQGVRGGRHFVSLWPAHQLEEMARLGLSLDACHQLRQRNDLRDKVSTYSTSRGSIK